MDNFVAASSVNSVEKKDGVEFDRFSDEWGRAKNYWVQKHATFDRNYLFYRGISAWADTQRDGFSFSKYFGTQVHVPRTFQTVESLYAQLSSREIEFSCRGTDFLASEKEKYVERMDNAEFARSGARQEVLDAFHNSLIFGNGYLLNLVVEDKKKVHIPHIKQVKNDDGSIVTKIEWSDEWVVKYKGVKPRSLNPYNVFPDPHATSMDNWRHCFVYSSIDVDELRSFAEENGWMGKDEAEKKIQPGNVENFDSVRESVDLVYNRVGTGGEFSLSTPDRKDTSTLKDNARMVGIVERYSEDGYELRINGSKEALYKDWNVYLHKEIPLVIVHDYKLPDELLAQGEPEIIRWQQIEENKIHNLVLYGTLMSVVQRYSVNSSLLEDPSDAAFYDPFRPIKVKAGLGGSVMNAVQPLPQPDVKQGPFRLMELVKEISQQTTGATDMLVAASQSVADTATESNNLMSATAQRVRAKIRNVELALQKMVKQWHKCFIQFYDDELDLPIGSEKKRFFKFVPYRKDEAETNEVLIDEARKKLFALGNTLTEVYLNKGYKEVVYLSDLDGMWDVDAVVKDSTLFFNQTLDTYTKILTAIGQVNNIEQSSGGKRMIDAFKIGEDMLRLFPMISDISKYLTENPALKKAEEEAKKSQGTALPGASQDMLARAEGVSIPQAGGDEQPLPEGGEMT